MKQLWETHDYLEGLLGVRLAVMEQIEQHADPQLQQKLSTVDACIKATLDATRERAGTDR